MSTVYLHYTGNNQITDNTNQAETRNSAIQALYSIQAQKQSGTHTGHGLPTALAHYQSSFDAPSVVCTISLVLMTR